MAQTNVEFNDVNVAPLFAWSREFEVVWDEIKVPVFMRILGDADLNRARVAALRKSAELRRKLKDIDSDERMAFIKDMDDLSVDQIVAVVAVFSMRDISERAQSKLKIKAPKQPRSDAKTSAHEKYQEEVDSYPARRQAELRSLLEKEVDILKKSLEQEPKEVIYKKYVNSMIDEMCEQEQLREFKAQCCYYGSYKNQELTERLFPSYEEFSNLQSDLKQQFLVEYAKLEMSGEELKKLQQVTQ
jgi:hypothetical protein